MLQQLLTNQPCDWGYSRNWAPETAKSSELIGLLKPLQLCRTIASSVTWPIMEVISAQVALQTECWDPHISQQSWISRLFHSHRGKSSQQMLASGIDSCTLNDADIQMKIRDACRQLYFLRCLDSIRSVIWYQQMRVAGFWLRHEKLTWGILSGAMVISMAQGRTMSIR